MSHLTHLSIADLTEDDLLLLDKACRWFYYGEELKSLLERIRDRELDLWRLSTGSAEGLIGTVLQSEGKELWIELLVGSGFYREAKAIRATMAELARNAGASRLSGAAVRPGLVRLYRDVLGATPVATLFSDEVK